MLKSLQQKRPDRRKLLTVTNHFFFVAAAVLLVQQNLLAPAPAKEDANMISQAINLQPRTPPPLNDPDQASNGDLDTTSSKDEYAFNKNVHSHLLGMPTVGIEAPDASPGGQVLTRADAPDREARALPRVRPE